MRSLRLAYAIILALTVGMPATAASISRHVAGHGGVQLRKRLNVNDLITDPGSVEIDWSSLYSISTTNYAMPSAVRFTPPGSNLFGGRTEYSLSFDSLTNAQFGGSRVTQFSDSLTAMATIIPWKGSDSQSLPRPHTFSETIAVGAWEPLFWLGRSSD